ncbi:F0F1 ATP synthase subunit delta [Sphingobacterium thermophilum]|uniref:ATP synthase subunit delta n=1 Tax=Sphingobacterium thermophilum TaxID=768534 RepID=A0ABP8QUJ6_9SPHI
MSVFKVASRYAKSILDLAQEKGILEQVKSEMEEVAKVIKSNSELRAVLANPIIKLDKKQNILKAIFEGKVSPEVSSFFNIMVCKGRGNIIFDTTLEFVRQYNELKGIVKAEVISAQPLSSENIQTLGNKIAEQINASVVLTNKVDSSLIGGFIIKVGDRQLDESVAGKLRKLERHFISQGI